MNFKLIFISWIFLFSGILFGQQSLNAYKYVIIPKNYDFLRLEDQYQLNSLTKFLFTKEGFTAFFDSDTKPQDLNNDPCLAFKTRVISNSSMITTKLLIELVDCNNQVIYTSLEGVSKLKDYKKAYYQAIRRAFEPIKALKYRFDTETPAIKMEQGEAMNKPVTQSMANPKIDDPEVVKSQEKALENENDKTEQQSEKLDGQEKPEKSRAEEQVRSEKNKEEKQVRPEKNKAEEQEKPEKSRAEEQETPEKRRAEETLEEPNEPLINTIEATNTEEKNNVTESGMLYAQETGMGYQLVDQSPKVIYVLIRTSKPDVYFLKNVPGIVYKAGESWIIELFDNNELVKKELQIKF